MSDSNIPVQSQTTPTPGPTFQVKVFSVVDINGNLVQIQGMALLDEFSRPILPLSESTGQQILVAIKAMHDDLSKCFGGIGPTRDNAGFGL